jgi:hypothetical protein
MGRAARDGRQAQQRSEAGIHPVANMAARNPESDDAAKLNTRRKQE